MKQLDPEEKDILITSYLLGETGEQETRDIEQATAADPEIRDELQQFGRVVDMVSMISIDVNERWEQFSNNLHSAKHVSPTVQKHRLLLLRNIAVAATIAVLLSIAGFLGYHFFMNRPKQVVTADQPLKFDLKDRSKITLNRNSELNYPLRFSKNNRTVTLKGEAFFEVLPDPDRPFIVETEELTVTVLGTSFYVRAFPGEPSEVLVETGRVKCFSKKTEETVILEAGETAVFGQTTTSPRQSTIRDLNTCAWRTYQLKFEDEPLENIIHLVNRAYGSRIETNNNIHDCHITVNFNNLSINGVLNVLKEILAIQIIKQNDKILITGEGC